MCPRTRLYTLSCEESARCDKEAGILNREGSGKAWTRDSDRRNSRCSLGSPRGELN